MESAERPFPVSSTARHYSEEKAKVNTFSLTRESPPLPVIQRLSPLSKTNHLDSSLRPGQSLRMTPLLVLSLAFVIGVICGLRSLTGPAVVAWAARLGWLALHGTPLAFLASLPAVIIFTALALAELIADKLPKTPSRTAAVGLGARFVLGGLCGAALALAGSQTLALGAVLGAVGGVLGAFLGYQVRTRLVRALGVPDFVIAVAEDLVAIGAALFVTSRF